MVFLVFLYGHWAHFQRVRDCMATYHNEQVFNGFSKTIKNGNPWKIHEIRDVESGRPTGRPKTTPRATRACPLNGQIECGIDRYVGKIVHPDWYVESIEKWIRTFILIGMWIRT